MKDTLLEIMYVLCGGVAIITALHALRDDKHPSGRITALFWTLVGIIFIFGKVLPGYISGIILIIMAILSATKKVSYGSQTNSEESFRIEKAKKIGNKLFIPAVAIGIVAFLVAQCIPALGALVGLGVAALVATVLGLIFTKAPIKELSYDGSRLLQQVGPSSILPQLLAALGALFTSAGVGEVISGGISGVISDESRLIAVIAYCAGMTIFTMIMGNAFAAFAVITAGIGVPFVIGMGANPAIAGALALTAGYCGTLLTPMAANFNIVPAAVLETKNPNRVIIAQAPIAIALWVTHVILMYFLAF